MAWWCCCAYVPAVPKAILEPRRATNSSSFPSSASLWISESVEGFCNNGREEQWAIKVSMGEETMGGRRISEISLGGDHCVAMHMSRYRTWTTKTEASVMLFHNINCLSMYSRLVSCNTDWKGKEGWAHATSMLSNWIILLHHLLHFSEMSSFTTLSLLLESWTMAVKGKNFVCNVSIALWQFSSGNLSKIQQYQVIVQEQ